jgi:hypothetical protein
MWKPVDTDVATSLIGEGLHTGLRKGTEAMDAMDLWRAISNSDTSAWNDALNFLVESLDYMGYKLCKNDKETPTT